ncbi:hypothetical protein [Glutamicibacter sp. NPDC087344]|uniref:hypothetical protein n=1 Tax=Glutamicibacter sp. NPDC087344 TaxID=3363994 RepID=UPI0038274368
MPGRIVRTETAERVTELLSSREGRSHLSAHGWIQNMPVVMTAAKESANDVMGLVSMHGRAVLVAMIDPSSKELKLIHISTPNQALKPVPVEADSVPIGSLFERAEREGTVTFRVKYWEYSAVAHPIPSFQSIPSSAKMSYSRRVTI